MSCNCKATKHILNIHKKYGHNTSVPWKEKLTFKTEENIKIILAFLLAIIFFPIFLLVLLIGVFRGKTIINFNKILNKLLRYKKNEQIQ